MTDTDIGYHPSSVDFTLLKIHEMTYVSFSISTVFVYCNQNSVIMSPIKTENNLKQSKSVTIRRLFCKILINIIFYNPKK